MKSTSSLAALAWAHGLYRRIVGQRWIRFGLVGGVATLSYFLLGLLFVQICRLPLLFGNALAYAISFVVSYAGQRIWTFQARGSHAVMLPKFAAAQLLGLGLNSLIVAALNRLGVSYWLSMIAAIAIVPVFVFLICKYWVFKSREDSNA